jgi:hypothetical protein
LRDDFTVSQDLSDHLRPKTQSREIRTAPVKSAANAIAASTTGSWAATLTEESIVKMNFED